MGKGKGSIKYFVSRVSPGTVLFELNATNEILARRAFKIAASKLPVKTKFVSASSSLSPFGREVNLTSEGLNNN